MFKRLRLRHLHLSLAAKCQLLFGTAVALIIAAALFVPWQRMEQLTDQLNRQKAEEWVRAAKAHRMVTDMPARMATPPIAEPGGVRRPQSAASAPTSRPTTAQAEDLVVGPRLFPISAEADAGRLPRLERRAWRYIKDSDDKQTAWIYEAKDGSPRYFYAAVVFARDGCQACHQAQSAVGAATAPGWAAASQPAANPKQRTGLISIDIPSQVDPNQLLLNRLFILTAGLLAGTLAIVVFYLITTRLILQPVRVLQETAEKVSQGDLNIRSDINTGDEFQQLSETFNTMLINLKAHEDQLRAINKSLDLKIGQLAESNVALYESNRLKSEFLANVSHELRTPLNSILGFAELLKEALPAPASTDAKTARYVQNIVSSGRNLLELINDLLDLAKIEAGRMEIRSEPLSLSDLFEGLSSILKPLCEAKGLGLLVSVGPDVPILHTDPAKLQQVLYNLLSNAIKFSPPGGQIDLTAQRHAEEHVRISVTDRGPGIEPAKQEVIFEKFRQIDGSVTRQHGGSGLGLSISKELVLLLSGSIGVRSTPGEGATFWIVLPLKIQAGTQELKGKLVLT